VDDGGGYVVADMTDDDLMMLRACLEGGLVCLGVGGLLIIASIVREWWRGTGVTAIDKARMDMMMLGTGMVYVVARKKYNPLYWLKGPVKIKYIKPQDVKMFYRTGEMEGKDNG
jgi:hypothetical protein